MSGRDGRSPATDDAPGEDHPRRSTPTLGTRGTINPGRSQTDPECPDRGAIRVGQTSRRVEELRSHESKRHSDEQEGHGVRVPPYPSWSVPYPVSTRDSTRRALWSRMRVPRPDSSLSTSFVSNPLYRLCKIPAGRVTGINI